MTFKAVCNDKSSQPGMVKLADGQTSIGERKPGDTMVFTLNSTVPSDLLRMNTAGVMELVNPYTLVFHDKMNEKLRVVQTTVTLKLPSVPWFWTPQRTTRWRHAGLSGGETLNVTLDLAALYNAGKITEDDLGTTPIVVSYTAKVVDDAINGDLLRNDAYVEFLRRLQQYQHGDRYGGGYASHRRPRHHRSSPWRAWRCWAALPVLWCCAAGKRTLKTKD